MRIATRGSALALWQAETVASLLGGAELVLVETVADKRLDIPIEAMGGKGVFVKEVQAAVLDGRADIAVHSAKDLPAETPAGLQIGAVPARGVVNDVLVGCRLADLPSGAHIATGSQRRRVQLELLRPDLRFSGLRGNIATRLKKAEEYDAIVMAAAALDRLQLTPAIVDVLPVDVMIPQVAQGALAVECRSDDHDTLQKLSAIEDPTSRLCVDVERAFLAELGGDCNLPIGAFAQVDGNEILLSAFCAHDPESPETSFGAVTKSVRCAAGEAIAVARQLAREI